MNSEEWEQLVNGYLNESLDDSEWDRLNRELERSRKSRDQFNESISLHQGLSEYHTTRQPILPIDTALPSPAGNPSARRLPVLLTMLYSTVLLGLLTIVIWQTTRPSAPLARIVWSDTLEPGPLSSGPFSIDSGFVEIEMQSGARFAMESGTSVHLIEPSRIRLVKGSIGAQVPERAKGFTVETSQGNIVDQGTRFGVSVDPETRLAHSELFDGKIEIHAGGTVTNFQGQAVISLSNGGKEIEHLGTEVKPLRYPMPQLVEIIPIVRGDFEPGENYVIADSKDTKLGDWGGNYARIVETSQGITPYHGKGMLQLVSSSEDETASGKRFCDVIQWVDFRQFPMSGATISASVRVNRVAGDEKTDTEFGLLVSAHTEIGEDKLITWNTSRLADSDPATWESLALTADLLPETRYISLRVGASENTQNDTTPGEVEFDGHYIDQVEMKLILPARPAMP